MLRTAPPRVSPVGDIERPVLCYTDGAHEPELDPPQVIPDGELLKRWKRLGKRQLITNVKLLPILVMMANYGKLFAGRRWVFFIDSNAVRGSLIKGSSADVDMFAMVAIISQFLSKFRIHAWFTRVSAFG